MASLPATLPLAASNALPAIRSESKAARPTYEYRCEDASVIAPWISRCLATRIHAVLPRALSANHITFLGSVIVFVCGVAVWALPSALPFAWFGPVALLIWIYCVLDHVDGCRARAFGTSGPVGEFLDHSLDAGNTFIISALVLACRPTAPWIAALIFAASALVVAATWCEQHTRRSIRLPLLGPVEGVVLSILFMLSQYIPALREAWVYPAFAGLTVFDLLVLAGAAGMFLSAASSAREALPAQSALSTLAALGAIGVTLVALLPSALPLVGLILGAATFEYAARVIAAHLNRAALPRPPLLFACLALVPAAAPLAGLPESPAWLNAAIATAVLVRASWVWRKALTSLQ